jgi:hypothetical protein
MSSPEEYGHGNFEEMYSNLTNQTWEVDHEMAQAMVQDLVNTYGEDILENMNPELLKAAGYD